MKILNTLQLVLNKFHTNEAKDFREYAQNKKEKKLVQLFNVLYRHRKTIEPDYVLLYLKEKKLNQNLRNNCKNLHRLILQFWCDNPTESDINLEITRLMYGASIIIKRGLIKEGLELYEKAMELAEAGEKYAYQYEIYRLSTHWKLKIDPLKSDKLLNDAEEKATLLQQKMHHNLSSNILASKVHSAITSCNWAFTEKDKQFFDNIEKTTLKKLEDKTITNRSKFVCHDIIGNINASLPDGKKKLVEFHTHECIKITALLIKEDPKKFKHLMILKHVRLLYLAFVTKERKSFQPIFEKFNHLIETYIGKDNTLEFYFHQIALLKCLLFKDFTNAELTVIPAALDYLEMNNTKIPTSYSWYLWSTSLEIKIANGKLNEAEWFINQMNQEEFRGSLPILIKYFNRLFLILYNYEMKNYKFVDNAARSTRRLYSSLLKGNPGGRLFLNYIIKLCNVGDESAKKSIFQSFKLELDAVLQNHFYQRIIGINLLSDWVSAKAGQR